MKWKQSSKSGELDLAQRQKKKIIYFFGKGKGWFAFIKGDKNVQAVKGSN